MLKPTKFYFYRHLIALAFIVIIGLRFGKIKGMLIVLIVYLALNADAIQWLINSLKSRLNGKL